MVNREKLTEILANALASYNNGHLDDAERLLENCILEFPDQADALHVLGLVKYQRGHVTDARTLIYKATKLNPNNPQYFNNLALILNAEEDIAAGLIAANKAVFLAPENADSQTTRGLMLQRSNRFEDASRAYRKAIELNPRHLQALMNLGALLRGTGDFTLAVDLYRRALATAPTSWEAAVGLGKTLLKLGKFNEAISTLEGVSENHRQDLALQLVLAEAHLGKHDAEIAKIILEKVVTKHPSSASAWSSLGYALRDLSELDQAESALKHALDLDPTYDPAAENLAHVLLSTGQFKQGWTLYRRRKTKPSLATFSQSDTDAYWSVESLSETSIIAWTEQGLGDEILQASLISDLSGLAGELVIVCSSRLKSLFEDSFPAVTFLTNMPSKDFTENTKSVAIPLIDIGDTLRPTFNSFSQEPGYLRAPPEKASALRRKYLGDRDPDTLLVGISWKSGNTRYGDQNTIPLEQWHPIFSAPKQAGRDVVFVATQFGTNVDYVEHISQEAGVPIIFDPSVDHGGDMSTVAAQIVSTDLVISTSTTAAQLAGALGLPTLHMTACGLACGWYWMADGTSTPWHPSMQIFRRLNGVPEQVSDVAAALTELAKNP